MQKEGTSCIDRHRLPVQPVHDGAAPWSWLRRSEGDVLDAGDPLGCAGINKGSSWLLWLNWYGWPWAGFCRDSLQQGQSDTL